MKQLAGSLIIRGMRGSRKFCQRGPALTTFFVVDEGREDSNITISGPSSARQRNGIKWSADDGPILNAGLVALLFSGVPDQYF